VAGVLEDDLARVGDQFGEHVRVADVDQPVAVPPHDQGRTRDLREAIADVVVEHGLQGLHEAGLARAP
jgi:hypothetical protein